MLRLLLTLIRLQKPFNAADFFIIFWGPAFAGMTGGNGDKKYKHPGL